MTLTEVAELLNAEVLCCEEKMESRISFVYAGDLMSDILVLRQPDGLLITGLVNVQVVRTAEMLDVTAILLIRGKQPTEEMIALAKTKNIPLLTTTKTLYLSCGILYEAGLRNQTA